MKIMHFIRISFLILTILFFSTKVFADDLMLPKPTGPYSVGTKAIDVKDPSRTQLRDDTPRHWVIQAFYPSEKQEGTYPYRPETLENGGVEGVKILAHAQPKATLLKKGPYPVVIFVPGFGEAGQNYTILCEELASHGYVVLSLDQPYVSNFVRFPNGNTLVPTLKDLWKSSRDRDYRYKYYDEAMAAAIEDIKFILKALREIKEDGFVEYLNNKEVFLMGHSFGGNVAHTLGFEDPRIKGVIDIDSKITERKVFGRVGVPPNPQGKPVLFIRGMMQYQEEGIADQLAKIQNAELWLPNVEHSAFSDNAYLAKHIKNYGQAGWLSKTWNWLFKTGPHFDAVDTDLGGQDVDQWFKDYRSLIVNWLDRKVG